jgi:serine/threonine protein kinase
MRPWRPSVPVAWAKSIAPMIHVWAGDVAVKISAERFSDRFSCEVRAVAALNHPNICQLYDVGPNYLVMELVEGPKLAERIKKAPIPLEEALAIAKQIAEAVETAHEKGIVHRDLKPGNIKLRMDGTVKVLDFGLAKMTETSDAGPPPEDSPTLTLEAATRIGTILGTAAYMSPEQARGKAADKRTDIWSFGAVLYEMLSGERAFGGESTSDILAGVLKLDPDWSLLPKKTPAAIRRLIHRSLTSPLPRRARRTASPTVGGMRKVAASRAALSGVDVHLRGGGLQPGAHPELGKRDCWSECMRSSVSGPANKPMSNSHCIKIRLESQPHCIVGRFS